MALWTDTHWKRFRRLAEAFPPATFDRSEDLVEEVSSQELPLAEAPTEALSAEVAPTVEPVVEVSQPPPVVESPIEEGAAVEAVEPAAEVLQSTPELPAAELGLPSVSALDEAEASAEASLPVVEGSQPPPVVESPIEEVGAAIEAVEPAAEVLESTPELPAAELGLPSVSADESVPEPSAWQERPLTDLADVDWAQGAAASATNELPEEVEAAIDSAAISTVPDIVPFPNAELTSASVSGEVDAAELDRSAPAISLSRSLTAGLAFANLPWTGEQPTEIAVDAKAPVDARPSSLTAVQEVISIEAVAGELFAALPWSGVSEGERIRINLPEANTNHAGAGGLGLMMTAGLHSATRTSERFADARPQARSANAFFSALHWRRSA